MNKQEYQRLVKKAALAYNLNSADYELLMDKATIEVDDWDQFLADFDKAKETQPTDRQRKQHERKQREGEIESAKRQLKAAQQRLNELLK